MDTPDVTLVALDPSMPAIDGFRAVLANLADAITSNWQDTIDRVDPEALHDLRVAIRRTRTVVTRGRHVLPPAIATRARAGFAWLGTRTGPARDLDVLLHSWDTITSPLSADAVAALEPVRGALVHRHESASAALIGAMQSQAATDLMRTWRAWVGEPTEHQRSGPHGQHPLGKVVAKRIERLQDRVLEGGRSIGPDSAAELVHALRKDAKKLRYMVECFGNLVPAKRRTEFIRRLKSVQDGLGEYQDAVVHIGAVRDAARDQRGDGAFDTLLATGQLIEQFQQQRRAALAGFIEQFADYDTKASRRAFHDAIDRMRP